MDAREVRVERGQKRIRVYLRGELIADTRRPLLVWELPYFPTYYVPVDDVRADLVATDATDTSPGLGTGRVLDVVTAAGVAAGVAVRFPDSPVVALRDGVRFTWSDMDE